MLQTSGQIRDIQGADIWVMDPNVQFSDDIKPLSDSDLYRVRGVPGVSWAVRLYKGLTRSRLEDGNFQQTILIGLDDATLVGAPPNMILGNLFDLRKPDAVIMDLEGYQLLWPGEEPRIGKRFEMNDKEAEIVGICKASRTFQTFPVVYTRYSQALEYVPPERKVLSFVLADVQKGMDVPEVCRRIQEQTGLRAVTGKQFEGMTMWYFMEKTGIPFNFGITVLLGFVVGTAIAAQTFYLFTIENIKQYGALKAMGAGNWMLMSMILLQAMLVSITGFGLGMGGATWFGAIANAPGSRLAFYMPLEVFVGTGLAVMAIGMLSSLLSMQRVMVVEPAVVFQG
jgi:putative ABC transport system permease protein